MPIDYERLERERIARMTPEERATYAARLAARERDEATASTIQGNFERLSTGMPEPRVPEPFRLVLGGVPSGGTENREGVERTWKRDLRVLIVTFDDGREILKFEGAVTGHEAYTLDQEFYDRAIEWMGRDEPHANRWYVCGGTPGRYDACWVETADVIAYLDERRPDMKTARERSPGA